MNTETATNTASHPAAQIGGRRDILVDTRDKGDTAATVAAAAHANVSGRDCPSPGGTTVGPSARRPPKPGAPCRRPPRSAALAVAAEALERVRVAMHGGPKERLGVVDDERADRGERELDEDGLGSGFTDLPGTA